MAASAVITSKGVKCPIRPPGTFGSMVRRQISLISRNRCSRYSCELIEVS